MKDISKLTGKTQGIESSDGKQLGIVYDIFGNDIAMDSYVGKRGTFILPRGMIAKIRKGTVYLNLTKEEFEAWWRMEGPQHIAEYPVRVEVALGKRLLPEDLKLLREDIITSFEMNFGGNIASELLGSNRCPICGSGVTSERGSCRTCGLEFEFIDGDSGQYEITYEYKEILFDEQERLRQKFSYQVREQLHLDEWVYHSADFYGSKPYYLAHEEEVIVVTSKRVFRFNPKRSRKYNWAIPIGKMVGVQTFVEDRLISGDKPGYWWWWDRRHIPVEMLRSRGSIFPFRIFQFDYESGRGIKSKEAVILLKEYERWGDRRGASSISKFVQRANKVMKIRKSMGIE
ncbi:MAG: hypothetical protein ACFE7E_04330 [Candidatus Hodarchaeota archaeon]